MKDRDKYIEMTKGIHVKEATNMKIMNPDEDNMKIKTTGRMKKDTLRNSLQETKENHMKKEDTMAKGAWMRGIAILIENKE
jgi:hypothetical protein